MGRAAITHCKESEPSFSPVYYPTTSLATKRLRHSCENVGEGPSDHKKDSKLHVVDVSGVKKKRKGGSISATSRVKRGFAAAERKGDLSTGASSYRRVISAAPKCTRTHCYCAVPVLYSKYSMPDPTTVDVQRVNTVEGIYPEHRI